MGTRLCVCLSVCLRSGIVRRRTSNKPDHHCQIALSLFLFPFSLLALIFCWQRYCQQLERTHTSKLSKLSPLTERRRKEEEEKEESLTALLEKRESEPKPGTTQSKKCSSKVEIGKEKKEETESQWTDSVTVTPATTATTTAVENTVSQYLKQTKGH